MKPHGDGKTSHDALVTLRQADSERLRKPGPVLDCRCGEHMGMTAFAWCRFAAVAICLLCRFSADASIGRYRGNPAP